MKFTIKKILLTSMVMILVFTALATVNVNYVNAATMPEYIKIGLKYGSSSANEYEVIFDNGVRLGIGNNDGFTEAAVYPDINKVLIRLQAGDIQLIGTKNSGETVILNENQKNINCIMPFNYENSDTVTFEKSKYRGGIMFNSISGNLSIINFLPIEKYLYGVINSELSKSFPMESLKAQSVAARSFAVCKLGTHNSYGFDLCTSTHCQVYKGYNDEYPETTSAVDETKGETINYNGKTVAAFYYKNSGGYTQDAFDVWGSNVGYLKAIKDEYSPLYPWSKAYTFQEISNKLSAAGYNVGNITNITITKRNQSGAVEAIQFTGTGTTAILQKDKIRSVLGSTVIKSTLFSIGEGVNLPDNQNKDFNLYVISAKQNNVTEIPQNMYIINKEGATSKLSADKIYIHNGKSTQPVSNMTNSAHNNPSSTMESISGGNVTFTGLGYGHGIGMPQDSAVEMAKKGFTYKDILKYYYTDITIE